MECMFSGMPSSPLTAGMIFLLATNRHNVHKGLMMISCHRPKSALLFIHFHKYVFFNVCFVLLACTVLNTPIRKGENVDITRRRFGLFVHAHMN